MSKGTIHVGDSHVFQSTPPALLSMSTTVGPSQCLVKVSKTLTLLPGDSTTFSAPPNMDPESHVMVEPNLDLVSIFKDILGRCSAANLKLKPGKVKLNIKSADILGLHWHDGKISPSKHKIDPLSTVPPPSTVKSLRSWLGSLRFHEICLPGSRLAALTKPLDDQIPSNRSGKDKITWTPTSLSKFKEIQNIISQPHSVNIPRKGDQVYLATDACSA